MANQKGTIDDLPFATSGGQPKQVSSGKPTDFTKPPYSGDDSARGGNRNFIAESRRQDMNAAQGRPTAPSDPIARANRAQVPSTPAQRVNPASIPSDGGGVGLPVSMTANYRRDTGSVGNDHKPFKNMR